MTIYPDTTFYVALRFFDGTHHEAAADCFEQHGEDLFLWSPWHRVEVCNTLRQFARGAQPVVREADARRTSSIAWKPTCAWATSSTLRPIGATSCGGLTKSAPRTAFHWPADLLTSCTWPTLTYSVSSGFSALMTTS